MNEDGEPFAATQTTASDESEDVHLCAEDAAHLAPDSFLARSLGINLNYWLFPGLILHELSHYLACILAGVRVHEVKLWGPDGAHVVHDRPRTLTALLVSVAPAIVGGLVAFFFLHLADSLPLSPESIVYYWFGISAAFYAFPSAHDLRSSASALQRYAARPRKGIDAVLAGILYVPLWLAQLAFEIHYAVFGSGILQRVAYAAVLLYLAHSAL